MSPGSSPVVVQPSTGVEVWTASSCEAAAAARCARNFRKTEPRGGGVAQERRLQYEKGVGRGNAVVRGVKRGNEERIPKRATFARALLISLQPIFEGFGNVHSLDTAVARAVRGEACREERFYDADFFGQR